MSSTNIERSPH